jgi:hypothetical protein
MRCAVLSRRFNEMPPSPQSPSPGYRWPVEARRWRWFLALLRALPHCHCSARNAQMPYTGVRGRLIAVWTCRLVLLSVHALAWNASTAGCATRLGSIQSSAYRSLLQGCSG